MELHELTASELKVLLDKREISAEQLTKTLLQRIAKLDPHIHAFISVCDDASILQARASDERRARHHQMGELEGIPVAVKDNICTKGVKTTCASRILANFIPPYDAHVIEKIQASGGIVIGKTNLDEFAMGSSCENSAMFPTHNPWNIDRIPGGSSGGSAAALAACMVPLALGSDTGGSIRQPAALTGTIGFKPTYGRVSRYGLVAFASSLDQIGPMARSVPDIALLLRVIAAQDARDSTCVPRPVPDYRAFLQGKLTGIKIGIPKEYFAKEMDAEIAAACEDAIHVLVAAGAQVIPVSIATTTYALPTYHLIATAEASSNLARYDGIRYGHRADEGKKTSGRSDEPGLLERLYMQSRAEGFGPEVKRRILLGTYGLSSGYYDDYYLKGMKVRTLIHREVEEVLRQVDVLVTPTSPVPAFLLGEKTADPLAMYLCDIFTVTFSLSGHPAISIPCGLTKNKLPIGLQIVGRLFAEETVLQVAYAYECRGVKIGLAPITIQK